MDDSTSADEANQQLDRVLGFFPRVESKASALFAMNTGVLAVAALNFQPSDISVWFLALPAALGLGLTVASIFYVYRITFPDLAGGQGSLIYFREIAANTEANYIKRFRERNESEHLNDILGQVWRNSEILKLKFDAMKMAFTLLVFSLVPWAIFLVASSVVRVAVPVL